MKLSAFSVLALFAVGAFAAPPSANAVPIPTSSCTMSTDYSGLQTCTFSCIVGQWIAVSATPTGGGTVAAGRAVCGGATAQCSSSTPTPCSAESPTRVAASSTGTCSNEGPLGHYAEQIITCSAYSDSALPCGEAAPNVYFCNTPEAFVEDVVLDVYEVGVVVEADVVGYLDIYNFTVADVIVSLPCVTLEGDSPTNPCTAAGGTFHRRLAVLVDQPFTVDGPVVAGSTSVGLCTSNLQLLVADIGIQSAPAYTIC